MCNLWVLCPEQLGEFCLGGCGIPPLCVITAKLIPLCTPSVSRHKYLCTYIRMHANIPSNHKHAYASQLIHLVGVRGTGRLWTPWPQAAVQLGLTIRCLSRPKNSPQRDRNSTLYLTHTHTHTRTHHFKLFELIWPWRPLNHYYSGTAMLSEIHKVLLVSTQSTPHLWTQRKEKHPSGLWADEQWMQTFRELNSLPSGLSGGLSRGHDALRQQSENERRLHAEIRGFVLYDCGIIKQKHCNACTHTHTHTHTQSTHVIMCTRSPPGTVPSLSLSLAPATSSGYGPVLFNFKHRLSLVPALSCSLCLTLCLSQSIPYYLFCVRLISLLPPKNTATWTKTGRTKKGKSDKRRKTAELSNRQ